MGRTLSGEARRLALLASSCAGAAATLALLATTECGGATTSSASHPDASTQADASLETGTTDTGADSPRDATTDTTSSDAMSSAEGGLPAGDAATGPNLAYGTVTFTECQGDPNGCATPSGALFSAVFVPAMPGCPFTIDGACRYTGCAGLVTSGIGAGTLTISGGLLAAPVGVDAGANGFYGYDPDGGLFTPGQTLTASASGDVVPAWGPAAVVAPSAATVLSPAGSATISSAHDLTVTWSGGQAGARFRVVGAPTIGFGAYFTCEWDASLGQGVIPKDLLAYFYGAGPDIEVGESQLDRTTLDAGGYAVSVEAVQVTGVTWTLQ